MKEEDRQLCDLHDLRLDNVEKRINELIEKCEEIEKQVNYHKEQNARFQEIITKFDQRFDTVDTTLQSVVKELKDINNKMVKWKTESDINDDNLKENLEDSSNNRYNNWWENPWIWIIAIQGGAILLLLGYKLTDIIP